MAFVFDNCLTQQGSGTNEIYGECCSEVYCTVTATEAIVIDSFTAGFQSDLLYFDTAPKILIDNVPQTLPLSLNADDTFTVQLIFCASNIGDSDTMKLSFIDDIGTLYLFQFDFESISFASSFDISSINFSNVPIGSSASQSITITNPTIACYLFECLKNCNDYFYFLPQNETTLCQNQSDTISLVFEPTTSGTFDCTMTIGSSCGLFEIPVTASAIEPPTGGTTHPQKNKVDQTTRVEACSPRTANNRCQTARTMQSAIRTNARRFGKR